MSAPINAPKPPFRLAPHERANEVWMRLEKHLADRLETLRVQNDGDQSEEATAKLRGRIAEIKALLNVGKDQPNPPPGQ
jgi:hypothetical protein